MLPPALGWAKHARPKEQTLQRAHENISLLFPPHHVLMADEKHHYTVLESKHGGRSNARNTGGAQERSRQTESQHSLPRAAPVHRALTQRQSHTESHRQPPPPRKRTLAHTPLTFGRWDAPEHSDRGGPEPHSRPGLPVQPRFLHWEPVGAPRSSPRSSTGHRGFPPPSTSRLQHRTPEGPGSGLLALPAALSPLPGGEEASAGGTASAVPCFGTPLLPERGAAAGLAGCWRQGGEPWPFSQPCRRLGSSVLRVGPL